MIPRPSPTFRRHFVRTGFTLLLLAGSALRLPAAPSVAGELDAAVARIDRTLLEQSERDIRAWLDARIAATGDFGVYPFGLHQVRVQGDTMTVDLNRGSTADAAAQFLRAYEMLGDRKYLQAGLKTADFYLQVQQPAGHLPSGATVGRGGKAVAGGGKHPVHEARLEDGYQFRPFALLLYAYRLSGDARYRNGAIRLGTLVTQRIQHPDWGWCPSHFDTMNAEPYVDGTYTTSNYGVVGGGSLADYCTTDGFRIAIMMYHLTGERKHLARVAKLGDWIHATQMGRGAVRGWADNYGPRNQPVPARHFEGLAIDPRNFNRYIGPMLVWLYAMTGEERHYRLYRETYQWLVAQEQPGGWASEYTYDGHPAWTVHHITYRYDQPETWPPNVWLDHAAVDGRPGFVRSKVRLRDAKLIHDLVEARGHAGLRQELFAPAPIMAEAGRYAAARLAAAQRCVDEHLDLALPGAPNGGETEAPRGGYLERVRRRQAAPVAGAVAAAKAQMKGGNSGAALARQSWSAYASSLPFGGESWQYVWDARLALGLIGAETLATGGRGLENNLFPLWHVMGDWTSRCLAVEDWMAVPLGEPARGPRE